MKKNFVKYFGVASTTLLAVAPVATPALMTASNLAVVKAGVQDDITAAFKADNSLVQLSADQWKGLTSTIVNEQPAPVNSAPASQSYLNELEKQAKQAKEETASAFRSAFKAKLSTSSVTWPANYSDSNVASVVDTALNDTLISSVSAGDGRYTSSIKKLDITKFQDWYDQVKVATNRDDDHNEFKMTDMFKEAIEHDGGSTPRTYSINEYGEFAYNYILGLPNWWFVSKGSAGEAYQMATTEVYQKFNAKKNLFTPVKTADGKVPEDPINNGLVTVAPKGGAKLSGESVNGSDYEGDEAELSYVGDNLVDLQKRTDNELLNLVPSINQGKNKSGTPFSDTQGKFRRGSGTVIADNKVSDGSKVWTTILQAVLNPKDAMYPLYDLTTSNIVKTKMLVNGKDATKNEFITKDEIQNADRISIQFVFKTNDGNEYKSPTVWLSHGAKYTVNTSGLANISRLPGDFYQPSAGITGTFNETGLPMDSKKFVVVPAGTDLANYTDKDGKVNISALAALQAGVLGTNGVAVNRDYNTAFEGGELSASQYWTDPSYFYSKFGVYNDAVDIYYIDGQLSGSKGNYKPGKTQAEYRTEAASAVYTSLKAELEKLPTDTSTISYNTILAYVNTKLKDYMKDEPDIGSERITPNIASANVAISSIFTEYTGNAATDSHPENALSRKEVLGNTTSYPVDKRTPGGGVDKHKTIYSKVTVPELFQKMISEVKLEKFKEDKAESNSATPWTIPAYQLNKVVANAARTTKVDVPSKYLPQVSFNNYKSATYYGNGATINNWFNYSWNSGSSANSGNDPYYPSGGVIVTGGTSAASSSAAKQPVSYLAPAAFAANSINADQLQARVTDNIQKFMSAKLSNPNTQTDSNVNGYFKGYKGNNGTGDAAYAYIKNGAVPASDLKIDTSKVDVTKPGTYYVEVTYTPLSTIKSNTFDGNLAATNGNVDITDANGKLFQGGSITGSDFSTSTGSGATVASTGASASTVSDKLTTFAADQIFANGAPATYKLPVQITDGSNAPQSGAPVIAFTEGGQNLKIAKGGTFDQFKGLQFYAYPGAKAWDQKDDSVKVEVSGKVNTNVEGTYTLVYTVTNKAGKTSTLTRVITVGDGVEKPTEYEFNLSQAYIDYVPGYNVREYGYPGDEWTGKQIKHGTSVSVTKRAVFQNGEEWYKLGDGNWVKKQYVKAGQNPNEAVEARGVVTVNYVPGYGIAVYKEPGKSALVQVNGKPKRLAHGTSWKSFKKQIVNNVTYYNVGGNQWVNGNFVIFK